MHIPCYDTDHENLFNPFSYVYRRLKVPAGSIATEIETNGIYGWDRFGRYKFFEPCSREAVEALDCLAAGLAHNTQLEYDMDDVAERWPFSRDASPQVEDRYGWSDLDMPVFDSVPEPLINESSRARYANSEAKLLAALLYERDFKFGRNRVSEMKRLLEQAGIKMSEKTISDALDRARNFLPI